MDTFDLVITRTFQAPRELVYRAWTEAEHLRNWWGPKGYELRVVKFDPRPGGMFLGSQTSPEGYTMWGKFVFENLRAPESISFIQSFCDEQGNTIRAPFNANWPLEIYNEIRLEEAYGVTTMTFQGGPVRVSEAELAAFRAMTAGLEQGFGGTFAQLDSYLQKMA